MTTPAFVVAGTHSGSGKTTVTLAILAALKRRGLIVQGFKVGPDFLDPAHHSAITGRVSRNLDTWLLGPKALAASYHRACRGAEVAVIEGVMGLFDGRGTGEEGSTADLAREGGLPVVLVVDAKGLSRSIAPLIRGFADFDPLVNVIGVIANRAGSHRHFAEYLRPAMRSSTKAEPLGYLTRDDRIAIPSRHLGLQTAEEFGADADFVSALADAAEATIDLDRLIALARPPNWPALPPEIRERPATVRVAVARDEAFCFYYEDNLELMRDSGAEVVPFSPLHDRDLPESTELLYLGGGYPELHAAKIAANREMKRSIRRFHDQGGPIYAECGGMMACCRELRDSEGRDYPLWDLIPARTVMHPRFQALGYVTLRSDKPSRLGPAGTEVRGHEFHYSSLEALADLPYATSLHREGREARPDGIAIGGLLAGYAHLHFGSNPAAARAILGNIRG